VKLALPLTEFSFSESLAYTVMEFERKARRNMRILIAEDDATSRRLLEALLTKWGYEVVVAATGSQAWELVQAQDAPRLVILDRLMPGMDGIELCKQIRTLNARESFYIILLTTQAGRENIVTGLEAGANDYVCKPYDHSELRARVRVASRVVELQISLAERIKELEDAVNHIKTLQGILPICMHCHKIRDDTDVWHRLEKYIAKNTAAMLSHSICPECLEKYYGKILPPTDGKTNVE